MSIERMEEIVRDLESDAVLYAKKAGEALPGDYERGASWAFALAAQRIAGDIEEIRHG